MLTEDATSWTSIFVTAVLGIGAIAATLFSRQFQTWWKSRKERSGFTTLGDLSGARPIEFHSRPGVLKADTKILEAIQAALPSNEIVWIHEHDFGNGFGWRALENVEKFNYEHAGPEHEFLDPELERTRRDLMRAIGDFVHYAALNTASIDPGATHDYRKIPEQYDQQGNYGDKLFFKKSKQINDSADEVWEQYTKLIREARRKIAEADRAEHPEQ